MCLITVTVDKNISEENNLLNVVEDCGGNVPKKDTLFIIDAQFDDLHSSMKYMEHIPVGAEVGLSVMSNKFLRTYTLDSSPLEILTNFVLDVDECSTKHPSCTVEELETMLKLAILKGLQ